MKKIVLIIGTITCTLLAFNQTSDKSNASDTDNDTKIDNCDIDSDNDGIIDASEDFNNNYIFEDDDREWEAVYLDIGLAVAGDGVPNYKDLDSDNDGILDLFESGIPISLILYLDKNSNGVIDDDIPKGLNGYADTLETYPDSGVPRFNLADTDADGIPDYLDNYSNGADPDLYVAGHYLLDEDGYGYATKVADIDNDGIQNNLDSDNVAFGNPGGFAIYPMTYTLPATLPPGTKYDFCGEIVTMNHFWLDFHIVNVNSMPTLSWQTTSSKELIKFEIEKSVDGVNFQFVSFMMPTAQHKYSYTDMSATQMINFYRINAVFADGSAEYSIVQQYKSTIGLQVNLYPNPTSNFIHFQHLPAGAAINIFDMQGRKVWHHHSKIIESIDVRTFTPGAYNVVITHQGQILQRSIITVSR